MPNEFINPAQLDAPSHEWWQEAIRRYDEAQQHPERLLDADTFFRKCREEIEALKVRHGTTD